MLESLLSGYFSRTGFVISHAVMLLIWCVAIVFSCRRLWVQWSAVNRLKAHLGDFDALRRELDYVELPLLGSCLKSILDKPEVQFGAQSIINPVADALSFVDGIIRFCINGFVVVGLMGTLYAFYTMWQTKQGTPPDVIYLGSMSLALTTSFVGLFLALVANLFFSSLRSLRQQFIKSLSSFVTEIKKFVPTETKEVLQTLTAAINARMEQLNNLIQNSVSDWQRIIQDFGREMLTAVENLSSSSGSLANSSRELSKTMIQVVEGLERTKEIGRIIEGLENTSEALVANISDRLGKTTDDWINLLSDSIEKHERTLQQQSETIAERFQSLTESVKNDFASAAHSAVEQLSKAMDGIVGEWKETLAQTSNSISTSLSTSKVLMEEMSEKTETLSSEHRRSLQKLSEDYEQIAEDLIAKVKASFDSTIYQVSVQRKLFIMDTASEINALAAKWMTEMSSHVNQTYQKMEGIVSGLGTSLTTTSATINTVLGGSENLVREVGEKIGALSNSINLLQQQAMELSDRTGAPVTLGRAAEELKNVRTSLDALIENVTQNQAIMKLSGALSANSSQISRLQEALQELGAAGNGNKRIIPLIEDIRNTLSTLRENLCNGELVVSMKEKPSRAERLVNRLRRGKRASQ